MTVGGHIEVHKEDEDHKDHEKSARVELERCLEWVLRAEGVCSEGLGC